MVKKTRTKYLLSTIRKNGVTFFSVALIAATSIAIYLGLLSGAEAILQEVNRYFEENKLASFEVSSVYGITQEDIELVAKQDEVDRVEGAYSAMVFMENENEKITLQARSLLDDMNQAVVLEGELPKANNEVAVEKMFAEDLGILIGDQITVEHDGELLHDSFYVTAIINEPSFVCAGIQDTRGRDDAGIGSASYYIEMDKSAFDTSYYYNRYTSMYVQNDKLNSLYYYSDAYEELETELKETFEDLGESEEKEWVISDRNSMGDVRAIEYVVDAIYGMSYSLAFIFLIVAIVVCYASIVRMIDDQKILIGAQKALGFHTKEILIHYLKYNTLCAALGVVLGYAGGVIIVENLILYVFRRQLLLEHISLTFAWKEAGFVAVLCFVIFLIATCAGCLKSVSQSAISLMRGESAAQKKAYVFEKWAIYKRCNLYTKTMIKNVLGDKGRIVTTIMGVVGCISLLIITFTMKLSIINAPEKQFEKYFLYENRLVIDRAKGDAEEFAEVLEEEAISFRQIQDKLKMFRADGETWENIHVVAVEDTEQIKDFLYLEDIETGEQVQLPTEGILISRKCAENEDLSEGFLIELMDSAGNAKEVRVAGVVEHYLPYHMAVMSTEYYEQVMEEETDPSVFLLKGNVDGLYEKVKELDGFLAIEENESDQYTSASSSLNMVIAICLVFSAVLAVLVLMNQITMYINRKAKELSVMRINGYTLKETKAFVSRDNIVLTFLGLLLGCAAGIPMAYFEVCIIESNIGPKHYVRTPSVTACLLAVAVCILFAWSVNKIALRKVEHLSLTNVNGN